MTAVVLLAAGRGVRMRSSRPKVLHEAAGRPLLDRALDTALALAGAPGNVVVVVSKEGAAVGAYLEANHPRVRIAVQDPPRGTGDAVRAAAAAGAFGKAKTVVVLSGDVPLLSAETVKGLVEALTKDRKAAVAALTTTLADPTGYGRVVRDRAKRFVKIVEEKDSSSEEKKISEISTGTYAFDRVFLEGALPLLTSENSQNEFYLTEVLSLALKAQRGVLTVEGDPSAALGVNSREDLAVVDRLLRERAVRTAMRAGTTILRPETVTLDETVQLGEDTTLEPFVTLLGKTVVGSGTSIGQGCVVKDTVFGKNVVVKPYCVIESAVVGDGCVVGPFARLREGTELVGGRTRRELRRDEEGEAPRGRQGEPPDVPGRHGDRGAYERRGGRDHVQLRRLLQAPDDDRRGRLRGLGHAARRARHGRRRRRHRGGHDRDRGRPEQRPRDLTGAAEKRSRTAAPCTACGRRRADASMCGIVGYVGPREATPILLDGLKRLEYRGYDSAGIAVVGDDGEVHVARSEGKLGNLTEKIADAPPPGHFGVGHTRWATHGRPSEENAHPHRDASGRIVVIHNGIIENFLPLKHRLQKDGVRFLSETDTEVVAHALAAARARRARQAVHRDRARDGRGPQGDVRARSLLGGRAGRPLRPQVGAADRPRDRERRELRRIGRGGAPPAHAGPDLPRGRGPGPDHGGPRDRDGL